MKDIAASILAFFFTKDKQAHPMSAVRAEALLRKIQSIIYRKEDKKHD